jgi:hypothetical protein
MLDPLEAPKPPTARPRVVAAACALPAARLVGAEAERSQQIALRAPDQIVAHARWARQPLFEREPPRKASRRSALHGLPTLFVTTELDPSLRHHCARPLSSSPPGLTRWSMLNGRVHFGPMRVLRSPMDRRVKPGDDESFRCRDAAAHPSFAYAKKSQAKKASPKTPPLKEGRRGAEKRTDQEPHRQAMRRASFLLSPLRENRGRRDLMERARSPFGAPPRHPRFF